MGGLAGAKDLTAEKKHGCTYGENHQANGMVQMIVFVSSVSQIDPFKCNNVKLGLILGFLAPFHNACGSE